MLRTFRLRLKQRTPGTHCPRTTTASRTLLIAVSLCCLALASTAQELGNVSGIVLNSWDGSPLSSVAISVRGTTLATQSDPSGRFSLNGLAPGDQALRFSKSGFASVLVTDVRVIPNQTTTVNANLRPEFFEMEEFEVTAEEIQEQTEKILIERQNSTSMMEAMGSDFLSKVGAGTAAESISKVSGATIVEGKFAVIRGLSDRYVSTTLNGAIIPSADPYRQSASLDLFPAQVIEQVTVSKTFTPDQPGAFTGGGIDIVTKSFPEKKFVTLSLGISFNSQATLNKNFLTYRGGGLDWAGMDDGTRALPAELQGQILPSAPVSTGAATSANHTRLLNDALRLDALTKALGSAEFSPRREPPPINESFSLSTGDTQKLFQRNLGYFAGVSYKQDYSFYEDAVSSRYQQGTQLKNQYRDSRGQSVVNWSGMVNLAYQLHENHELGFTFFYNQNGTDEARLQDQGFENNDESSTFRKSSLYWTERKLNTFQFKGDHTLPDAANLEFRWMLALTSTTQDEPDARFFNDNDANTGRGYESGANNPIPKDPTRYFRALGEDNLNAKLDWALPFKSWTPEDGKIKFGLFESGSDRSFSDQALYYPGSGGYQNDPNNFLKQENLGILGSRTNARNGNITFNWGRYIQSFNSRYTGEQEIQAAYLMSELPVLDGLKLVGGARYERTDFSVFSESYLASSVTGLRTNESNIQEGRFLPSLGLIYTLVTNMNLRLGYSQTLARPSSRELAAYYGYDPTIGDFIEGNPLLRMSSIDNYDLRWEWFFGPGELLSASFFYKSLSDVIERGDRKVDSEVITYLNRDTATLLGFEFEARKNLGIFTEALQRFSLGGNLALVQSEVQLTAEELLNKGQFFPDLKSTRPLYDQSPYILNLDLSYSNPDKGANASLIFNVAGPRITITKLNAEDVYEQPAPVLDFVISKKIGKNATLKFTVKNLLDPQIERTYGESSSLFYSSYSRGRTFGVSFSYDF